MERHIAQTFALGKIGLRNIICRGFKLLISDYFRWISPLNQQVKKELLYSRFIFLKGIDNYSFLEFPGWLSVKTKTYGLRGKKLQEIRFGRGLAEW